MIYKIGIYSHKKWNKLQLKKDRLYRQIHLKTRAKDKNYRTIKEIFTLNFINSQKMMAK